MTMVARRPEAIEATSAFGAVRIKGSLADPAAYADN